MRLGMPAFAGMTKRMNSGMEIYTWAIFSSFPRSCVGTHTQRNPMAPGALCIPTQERGNETTGPGKQPDLSGS